MPPLAVSFHSSHRHSANPAHRLQPAGTIKATSTNPTRSFTHFTISSHPYASQYLSGQAAINPPSAAPKPPPAQLATKPVGTSSVPPPKASGGGGISPGPSSSSSTTTAQPRSSARRKSKARRAPSLASTASSSGKPSITLTPLTGSILTRCLLTQHTTPQPHSTPRKAAAAARGSKQVASAHIHPYSRLTDLGNDRSPNPSPREIMRAQRAEEEKVQAKKDSAAAARAAIAARRRKGKSATGTRAGSRTKDSTAATRSPTPTDTKGKDSKEAVPTITTRPASNEASPIPQFPGSKSLKRTRSVGLAPVSTVTANALGGTGAHSPLRSVTGPEDTLASDETGDSRQSKRSRLGETRRASSLSPHTETSPVLSTGEIAPKTVPLAPGRLAPGTRQSRQTSRSTSIAMDGGSASPTLAAGALVAASGAGGANMRRVVSSAGSIGGGPGGGGSRRGSAGSQGSEGVATMRSRREVNLPRALRDYETRAGTTVQ